MPGRSARATGRSGRVAGPVLTLPPLRVYGVELHVFANARPGQSGAVVIPAEAGISRRMKIPACAGMTNGTRE